MNDMHEYLIESIRFYQERYPNNGQYPEMIEQILATTDPKMLECYARIVDSWIDH